MNVTELMTDDRTLVKTLNELGYITLVRSLNDLTRADVDSIVFSSAPAVLVIHIPWVREVNHIGHWVALFNVHGRIHFFSGTGELPLYDADRRQYHREIMRFKHILSHVDNLTFSPLVLQSRSEMTCGDLLVVEGYLLMHTGMTIEENRLPPRTIRGILRDIHLPRR